MKSYERRILVVSLGLTPQVVTETLFALWIKEQEKQYPTEVKVITTREGAERALLLLGGEGGWLRKMETEYGMPQLRFSEPEIELLDAGAAEIPGASVNLEATARAGALMAGAIERLSADQDCALHVSLAGGRKTAGFYLGQAMMIYGREQDRMSHVVVDEDYENNTEFFYPSVEKRVLYSKLGGKPVDAAQARIDLVDIPFVRLRRWIGAANRERILSYDELVGWAQSKLDWSLLEVDLGDRRIVYRGKSVVMAPAELAYMAMFARRKIDGLAPESCPCDGAPEKKMAIAFWMEYSEILYGKQVALSEDESRTGKALRAGMSKSFFLERRSRLRESLLEGWGASGLDLEVRPVGKRPNTKYELNLPVENIRFIQRISCSGE